MAAKRAIAIICIAAAVAAGAIWLLGRGGGSASPPTQATSPASASPPPPSSRPALPVARSGPGGLELSGRVVDGSGAAVQSVSVTAQLELGPGLTAVPAEGYGGQPAIVSVADAAGSFTLRGLERGRYRVQIEGPTTVTAEVRMVEVPGKPLRLVVGRQTQVSGIVVGGTATVMLATDNGELVAQTASSQEGQFVFKDVSEGSYLVAARVAGHATRSIVVEAKGSGARVVLLLEPALTVRGRVIDDRGNGRTGTVTFTAHQVATRQVVSDESGNFVMEDTLPGRLDAEAHAPGFVAAESVAFSAGRGFEPLLRLARAGSVRGTVSEGGRAVANARVEILASESQSITRDAGTFVAKGELGVLLGPIPFPPAVSSARVRVGVPLGPKENSTNTGTTTGGAGAFSIQGLAAGQYRLRVAHPDFAPFVSKAFSVSLGATSDVQVALSRGTVLSGTVRGNGLPVPFAAVTVRPASGSNTGAGVLTITDEAGRYRVPRAAGQVTVEVRASGFAVGIRRIRLAEADQRIGEQTLDIDLTAEAALRGKVADPSGRPIPGAVVETKSVGQSLVAISDIRGDFVLLGVGPGAHKVRVVAAGYPPLSTSLNTDTAGRLEMRFGGGISLRVRRASNRAPVAGAAIVLRGPNKIRHSLTSDAAGEATQSALVPGSWKLEVTATGLVPWETRVDLAAGTKVNAVTRRGLLVELRRGATVAGEVRDHNGEIVRGATVRVGSAVTRSDEFGRFRLRDVATGSVRVTANKKDLRGDTALVLAAGEERVTVRISIAADGAADVVRHAPADDGQDDATDADDE